MMYQYNVFFALGRPLGELVKFWTSEFVHYYPTQLQALLDSAEEKYEVNGATLNGVNWIEIAHGT